ncbi:MAG: DUF3883 domain-containing protein [Cellulomonas sp.]
MPLHLALRLVMQEPTERPEQVVAAEAEGRIRNYLANSSLYNPTRSLRVLSSQIAQEYEDRFLVELVQNAYDAQPSRSREGVVHIRLDERPEKPVLYVSNTGSPFTKTNFAALTNVALSSKPAGEGIGNKGVGFRSVLRVCDSPEIYSVDPANLLGAEFDGFCFGFATEAELRALVPDDESFERVVHDFSRYLLPVPVEVVDPHLGDLRSRGMVTVVRMPITDEAAVVVARKEIEKLLAPRPPIALFLDRIAEIGVEHYGSDGTRTYNVIGRLSEGVAASGDLDMRWVTTSGHRFLSVSRVIRAEDVQVVIASAIAALQIDSTWSVWHADAEVSVAVEPESPIGSSPGSLYTYLPMKVPSPLRGHLHAPFHTKMARLDLKEDSIFNKYLLRQAARVAVSAIRALVEGSVELPLALRQAAVVDLLSWDVTHLHYLREAMVNYWGPIGTLRIIPGESSEGAGWYRAADLRMWDRPDARFLTSDAIRHHSPLLASSLGPERRAAISLFCSNAVVTNLAPSDSEVAEWTEKIAQTLPRRPETWNQFLDEVAGEFTTHRRDVSTLQNRFILLDQRGRLLRAGPWNTSVISKGDPPVFFPPQLGGAGKETDDAAQEDAQLSEVPKGLLRAVAYLHPEIHLSRRVGSTRERTAVAEFLRSANLVERFELSSILDHVQRLLAGRVAEQTQRQALMWVYRQDRAARSPVPDSDLRRIGLRVPTRSGWRLAQTAYFSAGWGTERAKTLDTLLRESAHLSPTLESVQNSLLIEPVQWPVRIHDVNAFRDFLVRCGVEDGLQPVRLKASKPPTFLGATYTPDRIGQWFGLADERWLSNAQEAMPRSFAGPHTEYTGSGELWCLPGSDAHDSLSVSARQHFAAAILETVGDWPPEVWSHQYRRLAPGHRSRPDPHEWPSPVRSFIERAAWLPMSDPSRRGELYFVSLSEAWTFDETGADQAPRFARLLPVEYRRTLAAHPQSRARLIAAGLQIWNTPTSAAARLRELGHLLDANLAPASTLPSLRRATEAAWGDVLRAPQSFIPTDLILVVLRGSALDTIVPNLISPIDVFVDDGTSPLVAAVLTARALPLIAARADDGVSVAAMLANVRGVRVHPTSALHAVVSLDASVVEPGRTVGEPLIDEAGPWFERFVLTVLAQRPSQFVRITESVLHQAAARIRRARVLTGNPITLEVTGAPEAGGQSRDAVYLDDSEAPLLVLDNRAVRWPSWTALEVVADDLAQLIGQAHLAPELRAAALYMDRSQQEWRQPSNARIARALHVTEDSVEAFEREIAGSVETLRDLVAPAVAAMGGAAAYQRFVDTPAGNLEEVRALLEVLVGAIGATKLLESAERAETLDEVRRQVGISLGDFNDAQLAIGRQPLTFPDQHRASLEAYISEHRGELSNALRLRYVANFRNQEPLDDYVRARDFRGITVESAWLHDREIPSDGDLSLAVDRWKAREGVARETEEELSDLDEARNANAILLRRELGRIAATVHAWLRQNDAPAPAAWDEQTEIREKLNASGCLDFEPLTVETLVEWLAVLGLWPDQMPRTVDLQQLGIDPSETDPKALQARARAERARERDSVRVGGQRFDTSGDGLVDLLDMVKGTIGADFLGTSTQVSALFPLASAVLHGPGSRAKPASPREIHTSGPSNSVTSAIGLAGECLAYGWLTHQYKEATPRSWVSGNRVQGLGGESGDDTLGYDFVVHRRSGSVYFEVKATVTDELAFDIGESELRFARTARKDKYRILFVRQVFSKPKILVLPNPLDARFADSYQQVNQGIRFRFAPKLA